MQGFTLDKTAFRIQRSRVLLSKKVILNRKASSCIINPTSSAGGGNNRIFPLRHLGGNGDEDNQHHYYLADLEAISGALASSALAKKLYEPITSAVQSALLLSISDSFVQLVLLNNEINPSRVRKMAYFGFMKGFLMNYFYQSLEVCFPGNACQRVAQKLVIDQGIWSWFINGFFLAYNEMILNGCSAGEAVQNSKSRLISVQKQGLKFWPAAHILNYTFIPIEGRVAFVSVMGLIWSSMMCMATTRS